MEQGVKEDYVFYRESWKYYLSHAKRAKQNGFISMYKEFKNQAKTYQSKMIECEQAINTIFKP